MEQFPVAWLEAHEPCNTARKWRVGSAGSHANEPGVGELLVADRPWGPWVFLPVDDASVVRFRGLVPLHFLFVRQRAPVRFDRGKPLVHQIERPEARGSGRDPGGGRSYVLPPVDLVRRASIAPQDAIAGKNPLGVVVHLEVVIAARVDDGVLAKLVPVG